jgi:hypothetical protein
MKKKHRPVMNTGRLMSKRIGEQKMRESAEEGGQVGGKPSSLLAEQELALLPFFRLHERSQRIHLNLFHKCQFIPLSLQTIFANLI